MASRFGLRVLPEEQGPDRIIAGAQMLYEMSEQRRREKLATDLSDRQHKQTLDRMSQEAALNRQADEERFNRTREAQLSDRARELEMRGIVNDPVRNVAPIEAELPQLDAPRRSWQDRAVQSLVGTPTDRPLAGDIEGSVGTLGGGNARYDASRDLTRAARLQELEDAPNEFVVDGFRTSDKALWEELINTKADANSRATGMTASQRATNADRELRRGLEEATGAAREWLRRGATPESVELSLKEAYPNLNFGQRSMVLNDAIAERGREARAEGGSQELRDVADLIRRTQELARSQGKPLTTVEINQLIRERVPDAAQGDTVRALLRGERPR